MLEGAELQPTPSPPRQDVFGSGHDPRVIFFGPLYHIDAIGDVFKIEGFELLPVLTYPVRRKK